MAFESDHAEQARDEFLANFDEALQRVDQQHVQLLKDLVGSEGPIRKLIIFQIGEGNPEAQVELFYGNPDDDMHTLNFNVGLIYDDNTDQFTGRLASDFIQNLVAPDIVVDAVNALAQALGVIS